jgi:transposase InsO family protein
VGPLESSLDGNKWILIFIDDFSRMAFTYFLKSKNQVLSKFKEFKAVAKLETGRRIKTLCTDNGREYVNANFTKFLSECGIKHQLTIVDIPEQNGMAQTLNRTICEKAGAMIDSQCSSQLWVEAVNTARYIKNRLPHSALNGEISLEIWSGTKDDLSNLHVFRCKAYMYIPKIKRHSMWEPKSKETMFVGYYDNKKGFRLSDPRARNIEEARDVVFDKNLMLKTKVMFQKIQ